MTPAQDIIASAYRDARDMEMGAKVFAQNLERALTASGWRLVPPGDFDRMSIEAAAEIADVAADRMDADAFVCAPSDVAAYRQAEEIVGKIATAIRSLEHLSK